MQVCCCDNGAQRQCGYVEATDGTPSPLIDNVFFFLRSVLGALHLEIKKKKLKVSLMGTPFRKHISRLAPMRSLYALNMSLSCANTHMTSTLNEHYLFIAIERERGGTLK